MVEAEVAGNRLVVQRVVVEAGKEAVEAYLATKVVVVVEEARPSQASNKQTTLSEPDSSSALWTGIPPL